MLAPRISLKQLLLGMVGVAFLLALISLGYNGSMVAVGLSISILILPVLFLGYAVVYAIFSLFLAWGSRSQSEAGPPGRAAPLSGKSAGD